MEKLLVFRLICSVAVVPRVAVHLVVAETLLTVASAAVMNSAETNLLNQAAAKVALVAHRRKANRGLMVAKLQAILLKVRLAKMEASAAPLAIP